MSKYGIITHRENHVSFCGVGANGDISGSEPLGYRSSGHQTREHAVGVILGVFKRNGIVDYETIQDRRRPGEES